MFQFAEKRTIVSSSLVEPSDSIALMSRRPAEWQQGWLRYCRHHGTYLGAIGTGGIEDAVVAGGGVLAEGKQSRSYIVTKGVTITTAIVGN